MKNLSISEIKRQARINLKGKWGFGALLTFTLIAIAYIVPVLLEWIISGGNLDWQDEVSPLSLMLYDFVALGYTIAMIPLFVAGYWIYLSISRGNVPKIKSIFSIYKNGKSVFKMIGTVILIGLLVILWSFLFFIPGIIKAMSYSQTFLLMKDNPEYSPLQAIKESKLRMKGYKWKYFLLYLSFIGWAILAIFTVGIGSLWLYPYIYTSQAVFYNNFIYPQGDGSFLDTRIA